MNCDTSTTHLSKASQIVGSLLSITVARSHTATALPAALDDTCGAVVTWLAPDKLTGAEKTSAAETEPGLIGEIGARVTTPASSDAERRMRSGLLPVRAGEMCR